MVNVLVGKSVTLECESNAVPPPTITWYKNGRAVTESGNMQLLAEGQMLHIKGSEVRHDSLLSSVYTDVCVTTVCRFFKVSDTGQYVCKATNVAGQVDKNFHLNIYGTTIIT